MRRYTKVMAHLASALERASPRLRHDALAAWLLAGAYTR
jgi:hypothetical protein